MGVQKASEAIFCQAALCENRKAKERWAHSRKVGKFSFPRLCLGTYSVGLRPDIREDLFFELNVRAA
ncbi:MAG: hypothetical protein GY754_16815 [bacterium]|nr:hypothetical protein [bacterium]